MGVGGCQEDVEDSKGLLGQQAKENGVFAERGIIPQHQHQPQINKDSKTKSSMPKRQSNRSMKRYPKSTATVETVSGVVSFVCMGSNKQKLDVDPY